MGEPPPFPLIVGSPRSGTTLLRLMLDAHPDLAIPPETGFLPGLAELQRRGGANVDELLAAIAGHENWPDFDLDRAALRDALAPCDPAGAARAFYRLYARRHGKSRWGDKTAIYGHFLVDIESLLPEVRVVHIIRDGRDVAISLRRMWFSPGSDMHVLAGAWSNDVTTARTLGARCRHYLETRFEELVREPEPELRRICTFLELPFSDALLHHHEGAAERLAEHKGRGTGGVLVVSRERRLEQQRNSIRPPDPSLIGRWRDVLSSEEVDRFEGVAGGLLRALGYPT